MFSAITTAYKGKANKIYKKPPPRSPPTPLSPADAGRSDAIGLGLGLGLGIGIGIAMGIWMGTRWTRMRRLGCWRRTAQHSTLEREMERKLKKKTGIKPHGDAE